jgi:flagellar biosynthesis/type III secretory pathway protein FliH
MLLFCPNCKIETEQNYITVDVSTQRTVTRCLKCNKTNFIHDENKKSDIALRSIQNNVETIEEGACNNIASTEEESYWTGINRGWKGENEE